MIVTFCGHHDACLSENEVNNLNEVIISLIQQGANTFYLGGYGSFDFISASAVKKAKILFPNIKSILVIPYMDRKFDTSLYDESLYPPLELVPKRFAISKRNEWIVNNSDVIIAYVTYNFGGASKMLSYAEKKKKRIIRINSI